MATVTTHPVAGLASTTNGNTYTFGSGFTPTANSLLTVWVYATGTVDAAPTMSGGSLTWTRQASGQQTNVASTGNSIYLFTAQVGGSPASTTPSINFPTDAGTGCLMSLIQTTGHNSTSPIVQAKVNNTTTTGANASLTFTSAVNTNNAYFIGWVNSSSAGNVSAPPSGWTEGDDIAFSTPNSNMATAYRDGGESTTGPFTFTNGSTTWLSFGVEIAVQTGSFSATASGSGTVTATVTGTGSIASSPGGTGAQATTVTGRGDMAGSLSSSASLSVSGLLVGSISSTLTSTSTLAATITGQGSIATAALTGTASISSGISGLGNIQSTNTGAGQLSALVLAIKEFQANLSGSGLVTSQIIGLVNIQAALNAAGSVVATVVDSGGSPSLSLSGFASLAGQLSAFGIIQAPLSATGQTTSLITATGDMAMQAPGTSSLSVDPSCLASISVNFVSSSSLIITSSGSEVVRKVLLFRSFIYTTAPVESAVITSILAKTKAKTVIGKPSVITISFTPFSNIYPAFQKKSKVTTLLVETSEIKTVINEQSGI